MRYPNDFLSFVRIFEFNIQGVMMLITGRCSVAANANEILRLEKELSIMGLLSSLSSLFTTDTTYVTKVQNEMNKNKLELLKILTNDEVKEDDPNDKQYTLLKELEPFVCQGNHPMIKDYFDTKVDLFLSNNLKQELSLLEIILKNENNKTSIFLTNDQMTDEQRYTIEYGLRYDVSNLRNCCTVYLGVETNLNVKSGDEVKKYPFIRCEYIFDVDVGTINDSED